MWSEGEGSEGLDGENGRNVSTEQGPVLRFGSFVVCLYVGKGRAASVW